MKKQVLVFSIFIFTFVLIFQIGVIFTSKLVQAGILTKGSTELASVASDGSQGNNGSGTSSISADGHLIAFVSSADNLVPNDINGLPDAFVRNQITGDTFLASIASDGTQANGQIINFPGISADGQYVVFESNASNLVANDTNGFYDIFVRNLDSGQTLRVSVDSNGMESNGNSYWSAISADGRYIVFQSDADNLVSGDTNGVFDVFVHDQITHQTKRVSVDAGGTQGNNSSWYPNISANGRYIAFMSNADNLVINDTNAVSDIFVHDQQTNQIDRVSISNNGIQGNADSNLHPSLSADGRYVSFYSNATNLVIGDTNNVADIFVFDRQTSQIARVSIASDGTQGNDFSASVSMSSDGRYVTFHSPASNLVGDDTNNQWDVFVHDQETGQTTRVSVHTDGTQGNDISLNPRISADGRYVTFNSPSTNLVSDDTNNQSDGFVHDRNEGQSITSVQIPLTGGSLTSLGYHTSLTFPADTFTATTVITHTGYYPGRFSIPDSLKDTGYFFDLTSVYSGTSQLALPTQPYTITIEYYDTEISGIDEDSLALYFWNGTQWIKEKSSIVNAASNSITATPIHFSSWALLGEPNQNYIVFLPTILRD